jgi:hypothetical protein
LTVNIGSRNENLIDREKKKKKRRNIQLDMSRKYRHTFMR